jgi:hypothetical protein
MMIEELSQLPSQIRSRGIQFKPAGGGAPRATRIDKGTKATRLASLIPQRGTKQHPRAVSLVPAGGIKLWRPLVNLVNRESTKFPDLKPA